MISNRFNHTFLHDLKTNYSRIIRGLKSGDRVLAKYDQQLDDGQKVKIK